jgi:DMSO/TMAO reductase YedYZ molybdopterin-dependent catalytic subunit
MKLLQRKVLLIVAAFCIFNFLPNNCYSLDPPPLTPVDQFFVQNHSDIPPVPTDWHLVVDGAVTTPLSLTLQNLMQYAPTTIMATLACNVPSPPSDLIGNANWTGVRLNTILGQANPQGTAQTVFFHCLDGYVQAFSLQSLLDRNDIILAYRMNGAPLPTKHGFPLRLVLPGSAGFKWTKWLDRIEIQTSSPTGNFYRYPLHAKMFAPQDGDYILRGTQIITGFAFDARDREIVNVEISTDDGVTWAPAELLNSFVPNVWKHWQYTWDASQVGTYNILARVEDDLGNIEQENGMYSWRNLGITVNVDYDIDGDSVPDGVDNCPNVPNGSGMGSCFNYFSGDVWDTCTDTAECQTNGEWYIWCDNFQNDPDSDGLGNVCDNCPYNCNVNQLDADTDSIGDVCDLSPGCGGCGLPDCEQECLPIFGPPADHTINNGGFSHKEGLYQPEINCTACHGAGLSGDFGITPSCYSCHSSVWNFDPPADHTINNSGFSHKEGLYQPEINCTVCHGIDLMGGFGPSCYSCHSDIWK